MVATELDVLTREQVPVAETWDLSSIFTGEVELAEAIEQVDALINTMLTYRGRIAESADMLSAAFDTAYRLQHLVERIHVFSRLTFDEDTTKPESQARLDQATGLSIRVSQSLAWFDPELLAVPADELESLIASNLLTPYKHAIDDIVRNRPYTRSQEIEELLVSVSDIARTARESFGALDNSDLTYGTVVDESGNTIELTKGRYGVLEESRDREVRKSTYATFIAAYEKHKHTLASLHAGSVRNDVFYAKARGFRSACHRALNQNAIDEQVYDTLIGVTRSRIDIAGRYLELRRSLLGVDQLEIYDSWVPLAELPNVTYSWAAAVDLVCDGLAALGDNYVSVLREGMTTGRWVDVQETKGKRSGAYSWGAYGSPPKILMNWNGTLTDVFTLAHEAGHAMHTYLANESQPYQDAHYPIFLAEIASTLNEVLLTWHLLGTIPAEDKMTRFAILNRFADHINGAHVRQVMFAEFERETHRIVEASEPLVLQRLNELFGELYRFYVPGMNVPEESAIGWSRIPHFYTAFYVYQYATGVSASIALAKQVRDEGQPAVDRVIRLFQSGGKDYPLTLLQEAGVDLTRPDAIEACMDVFEETIAELETIARSGTFTGA